MHKCADFISLFVSNCTVSGHCVDELFLLISCVLITTSGSVDGCLPVHGQVLINPTKLGN